MLTSSASPSPYPFGGLSPQTVLENEKLSILMQKGSSFALAPELFHPPSPLLKSRIMRSKNENIHHELEKLQELLTDALMEGKDRNEGRHHFKEKHLNISLKINAEPSHHDKTTTRTLKTPSAPTTTTSIPHPFVSAANKKKANVRKSVRMIDEELINKLNFYRCNPAHYEVFKNKILTLKEEKKIAHRTNVVSKNIKNIHHFTPEAQKQNRITKAKKNQMRSECAKKAKEADLEALRKKQDYILEQSLKAESAIVRSASNKNDLQRKWLILGSLASRIYYFKELLIQSHEQFFLEKRMHWAACCIQRAWRHHVTRVLEMKKRKALKVIGRVIRVYIGKKREEKKEMCANHICILFKEMHDMGRLHKIIKKYRFQVVKAQRLARTFIYLRKCQLYLLTLQWINFEPHFFSQINSESLTSSGRRKSSVAGKKKKEEKKELRVDITTFPDSLRESVLMDALVEKRKAYTKAKIEYAKKMDLFHVQKKRKANNNESGFPEAPPPSRPVLHILFNEDDLKAMMKKTYDVLQATT